MEDVSQVFLEERNGDFVWESFVHQKSHKVKYLKKKYWDSQEKPKLAKLLRISWAKTTEKKDSEVAANEPEADQAGMLPRVRTGISEKAQGGDTQSGCWDVE